MYWNSSGPVLPDPSRLPDPHEPPRPQRQPRPQPLFPACAQKGKDRRKIKITREKVRSTLFSQVKSLKRPLFLHCYIVNAAFFIQLSALNGYCSSHGSYVSAGGKVCVFVCVCVWGGGSNSCVCASVRPQVRTSVRQKKKSGGSAASASVWRPPAPCTKSSPSASSPSLTPTRTREETAGGVNSPLSGPKQCRRP